VGIIIFSIAIIIGVILTIIVAEPDFEATMYGFTIYHYPRLSSLNCPVLMTSQDLEPVTVKLSNRLDRPLSWYVSGQFSSNNGIISMNERMDLQPGESKVLSWEVGRENVVLGNFVFAYTYASSISTPPRLEATCGILVLNLPFKGGPIIFYTSLLLSVLGILFGWIFWSCNADRSDSKIISQSLWMRFMTVEVAIGVITGIVGIWFLALLTVFLAFLSSLVYVTQGKA
jgi:hypothetical protein